MRLHSFRKKESSRKNARGGEPNNIERFALSCAAFIQETPAEHSPTTPTDSNEGPPNHTIIVDAEFWQGKGNEGIVCEHYPRPPPNTPKRFVLRPRIYTATVSLPFSREVKSSQLRIESQSIWLGVHHLHKMQVRLDRRWIWYFLMSHKSMATQGVTADKLVVSSWNYSLKNGVYMLF